jgi:hypothetical protein
MTSAIGSLKNKSIAISRDKPKVHIVCSSLAFWHWFCLIGLQGSGEF